MVKRYLGMVLLCGLALGQQPEPYKDPSLPPHERSLDLLGRMNLEEKVAQMWQPIPDEVRVDGKLDPNKARDVVALRGAGSFLSLSGDDTVALQEIARKETRLGIPLLFGIDAIHGHTFFPRGTIFPMPLALSTSWNPELIQETTALTARELRASGAHWDFAPILDVARDPRFGRVVEGFGEDPYLVGVLGQAAIRGYQTPQDDLWVMATAKHFVGYSETVGGRDYSPADISERTLQEVFLPPFKDAVDVKVSSVMTSFNEIGGVPMTANQALIRDHLKAVYGFGGIVVSDYASVRMLQDTQFVAPDLREAARLALAAGVDVEMTTEAYVNNLVALVKSGVVPEEWIDQAVLRILTAKFALGLFEDPYRGYDLSQIPDPAGAELTLRAAREAIVLLENDGTLPVAPKGQIAVIGPLADAHQDQLGGWTGEQPRDSVVTYLDGLKAMTPAGVAVEYVRGSDVLGEVNEIARAVKLASESDLAVLVVGESANMSSEPNSRSEIDLPGIQPELVRQVIATGTPTVVVVQSGRPLVFGAEAKGAAAVLWTAFSGQQGGTALAEIIFGKVNPSAKLTMTFPRALGQIPIRYWHHPQKNWDHETYGQRYIDLEDEPAYPFGHGLTYTTFKYSGIKVEVLPPDRVRVSFNVTNSGTRPGTEIAQVYLVDEVGSHTPWSQKLVRYTRVELEPGETKPVSFDLSPADLAAWNGKERVLEPGTFQVMIGSSSTDTPLKRRFTVAAGR